MELIKFIFSGFWVFIGFVIIIFVIADAITNIVANICKTIIINKKLKTKKDD